MRISLPRVLRRFAYARPEYYVGASIPAWSITEVRLYPPRVLRRCVYTRLVCYGVAPIPAKNITEVRLYPPRELRRCVYTRLEYCEGAFNACPEYYGGASIPA